MVRKGRDTAGGGPGILYCSFCGKNQNEVRKLVAGPPAYHWDEGIEACRCIGQEEGGGPPALGKAEGSPKTTDIKKIFDS